MQPSQMEQTTMATTISISGSDFATLAAHGLDDPCQQMEWEFRNEWTSDHGDGHGEWFTTIENHLAPDGKTYHVLVSGTYGNDHSPGASHYTHWELYPIADSDAAAQFGADVKEWEAKPETDPDYVDDCDDE